MMASPNNIPMLHPFVNIAGRLAIISTIYNSMGPITSSGETIFGPLSATKKNLQNYSLQMILMQPKLMNNSNPTQNENDEILLLPEDVEEEAEKIYFALKVQIILRRIYLILTMMFLIQNPKILKKQVIQSMEYSYEK